MLVISATDEAIWHFLGLFHITDEVARLRIDYDKLIAPRTEIDPGQIVPKDVIIPHPYGPRDYLPELVYDPPAPVSEAVANAAHYAFVDPSAQPFPHGVPLPDIGLGWPTSWGGPDGHGPNPPPEPPGEPEWVLPVAGSVVTITFQHADLLDSDFLATHAAWFGPGEAGAQLQALYEQAESLGIQVDLQLPADQAGYLDLAQAFQSAEAPEYGDADVTGTTLRGPEVLGRHQDGAPVDARPEIDTLLPAYHSERLDERTDDDPDDGYAQHELVLGHNVLLNQASITEAWITAPVMAAGKGVYSYTLISQTNVWNDSDAIYAGIGAAMGSNVDHTPTNAMNYASFSVFENPAQSAGGGDGAPQFWLTATLQGSLVCVNWIDQFNFITDNDVTTVTLEADKTLMLIGDNGSMNEVSLTELGMQYDLIIVDGYIINLNAILQTNVMLDSDRVLVDGGAAQISSGDNLLVNDAVINQTGTSNVVAANASVLSMLAAAADGDVALPASILNDPAFEGRDLVRVLHIKGDMVSVNMIRQTNVLGDADQIEVYIDNAIAAGGDIRVISGSNVLINSATINEFGVDSTIHSGGEYYTDALLHQANLIDHTPPPVPDGLAPLAPEAVLFLADGLIGDSDDDPGFRPIHADAPISSDSMETVLS